MINTYWKRLFPSRVIRGSCFYVDPPLGETVYETNVSFHLYEILNQQFLHRKYLTRLYHQHFLLSLEKMSQEMVQTTHID